MTFHVGILFSFHAQLAPFDLLKGQLETIIEGKSAIAPSLNR
jgi:hypothetical protein